VPAFEGSSDPVRAGQSARRITACAVGPHGGNAGGSLAVVLLLLLNGRTTGQGFTSAFA